MVQPHWKTVWQVLKRLNIELPYDPVTGRYILKKNDNMCLYKIYTQMSIRSIICNSQQWKQTKCSSTDE